MPFPDINPAAAGSSQHDAPRSPTQYDAPGSPTKYDAPRPPAQYDAPACPAVPQSHPTDFTAPTHAAYTDAGR